MTAALATAFRQLSQAPVHPITRAHDRLVAQVTANRPHRITDWVIGSADIEARKVHLEQLFEDVIAYACEIMDDTASRCRRPAYSDQFKALIEDAISDGLSGPMQDAMEG